MKDYEFPEYERQEEPSTVAKWAFAFMFSGMLAWIVFVLHFLPFSSFCKG